MKITVNNYHFRNYKLKDISNAIFEQPDFFTHVSLAFVTVNKDSQSYNCLMTLTFEFSCLFLCGNKDQSKEKRKGCLS